MDDTSAGAPLLAAMGLPPASELVYRLLLERPGWGVTDLVTHLGLSETAVRAALVDHALRDVLAHRPHGGQPEPDRQRPPAVART